MLDACPNNKAFEIDLLMQKYKKKQKHIYSKIHRSEKLKTFLKIKKHLLINKTFLKI